MTDTICLKHHIRLPHLRLRASLCRLRILEGCLDDLFTLRTEDYQTIAAAEQGKYRSLQRQYGKDLGDAAATARKALHEIRELDLPVLVCMAGLKPVLRWLNYVRSSIKNRSPIHLSDLDHVRRIDRHDQFAILEVISETKQWTVQIENQIGRVPRVFIASSTEGEEIADHLASKLTSFELQIAHWNHGEVFVLSRTFIESLERTIATCDFGVFLFTPDDMRVIRGQEHFVARDNVVFEFGMFVGLAGRLGAFVVAPAGLVKPTDFAGLVFAEYERAAPLEHELDGVVARLVGAFDAALPANCG